MPTRPSRADLSSFPSGRLDATSHIARDVVHCLSGGAGFRVVDVIKLTHLKNAPLRCVVLPVSWTAAYGAAAPQVLDPGE